MLGDLVAGYDALTTTMAIYDHPRHKALFYRNGDPHCPFLLLSFWRSCHGCAVTWTKLINISARPCFCLRILPIPILPWERMRTWRSTHTFAMMSSKLVSMHNKASALWADHQFVNFQSMALCVSGWALVETGRTAEGRARLQEGLAMCRQIGMSGLLASELLMLAASCLKIGQSQQGLDAVTEALAVAEQNNEHWCEAELYRLRGGASPCGKTNLRPVDITHRSCQEAETCFQRAIEIAQLQGASLWGLRATLSRCRLWQQEGRCEDAYRELHAVYNAFTEGFQTTDLQEAQALLTELAASQSA